jgi:Gas vesicle synthesis protein GvpO
VRPAEIVTQAKQHVGELTGLKVEGATGFERNGDGWIVTVVALELSRTPNTMDVLGTYEVVVADDGELQQFKRTGRAHRAAVEERTR